MPEKLENEGDIIRIDKKEDGMTVEKEGECLFCHKEIQPGQASSKEWVKGEDGKMVQVHMHNNCRYEHPDEMRELAA